jgi:hypothetical protein
MPHRIPSKGVFDERTRGSHRKLAPLFAEAPLAKLPPPSPSVVSVSNIVGKNFALLFVVLLYCLSVNLTVEMTEISDLLAIAVLSRRKIYRILVAAD